MKIHTKTALSAFAMLMLACLSGQSMAQNTEFRYQKLGDNSVKVGFWNNAYYTKDRAQELVFEKIASLAINEGARYFALNDPKVSTDYVASGSQGNDSSGEVVKTMISAPPKARNGWKEPGVIIFPRYFFTTQVTLYDAPPQAALSKVYNAKMVLNRQQLLEQTFRSVKSNAAAVQSSAAGREYTSLNNKDGSTSMINTEGLSDAVIQWTNKSYRHLQSKQWVEAIRTASAAINLNHDFDIPYVNRATAYIQHGYQDKASTDVDTALALNPDNALAINMKGYLVQEKGATDEAMRYYSKACSKNLDIGCSNFKELAGFPPNDKTAEANFYLDQSKLAMDKNRWKEVIDWSTKAIDADPSNFKAFANRAGALAETGHPKEALLDADQAISLNPDFGPGYHNRGYAYKILGNERDAALEFEIGCKLGVSESCEEFKNINSVAKK